jgi:hypothetical protein
MVPRGNVSADHEDVIAGSFEGLLGILMRDESGIFVQGQVPFPTETIKHRNQTSVLLVDARPDEFYDRYVMPRLTSGAEGVAKHEA